MPDPASPPTELLARGATLLAIAFAALTLAACGTSSSSPTTSTSPSGSGGASNAASNQQNAAQTKLQDCLRKEGIDLPTPGSGTPPQNIDRDKLQAAFDGPCKAARQAALGGVSSAGQQQFSDQLTKFASCMRKRGVDVGDPTSSGGVPSGSQLDTTDPKVQAATKTCRSTLLQGVPGAGSGQ